ncbi:MAG: RING finger domain-containing protein, partial [Candidatus Heimdallarchaeaceae archaeon]
MSQSQKLCTNCKQPIESDWKFCKHCRAEILKCEICFVPFDLKDEVLYCPFCRTLFHKEHIMNWLSSTDFCPHCKHKITLEEFVPLSLETYHEYRFDLDLDEKPDPTLISKLKFQQKFWRSQELILEKFDEIAASVKRKFY